VSVNRNNVTWLNKMTKVEHVFNRSDVGTNGMDYA
jgi:hypothetical protein